MDNEFWSQALASLLGAFSAFVLSIILFFITQSSRTRRQLKDLAANSASEIETNISILKEIKAQIDDLSSEIELEKDVKKLYIPMRFKDCINVFIPSAYSEGLLRKLLSSHEVTELNRVLGRNSQQNDDLNLFVLDKYKDGTQDKAETLRFFREEKKLVEKDMTFLEDIQGRLKRFSLN